MEAFAFELPDAVVRSTSPPPKESAANKERKRPRIVAKPTKNRKSPPTNVTFNVDITSPSFREQQQYNMFCALFPEIAQDVDRPGKNADVVKWEEAINACKLHLVYERLPEEIKNWFMYLVDMIAQATVFLHKHYSTKIPDLALLPAIVQQHLDDYIDDWKAIVALNPEFHKYFTSPYARMGQRFLSDIGKAIVAKSYQENIAVQFQQNNKK